MYVRTQAHWPGSAPGAGLVAGLAAGQMPLAVPHRGLFIAIALVALLGRHRAADAAGGGEPAAVEEGGAAPMAAPLAPDETVILPHPPLPLAGVSIVMERERQQNGSLVNG